MTDEPLDPRVAVALAALAEVTDPADVGPLVDAQQPEPGVVDLRFACTLAGYPDWRWTVSTAEVGGAAPTVLEIELLPGEGSLLAPPWVPWTERLAEWRRSHGANGAESEDELDEEGDDLDDEDADDELDEDDADEDEAVDPDDELDEELGDDVDDADEDVLDDDIDVEESEEQAARHEDRRAD